MRLLKAIDLLPSQLPRETPGTLRRHEGLYEVVGSTTKPAFMVLKMAFKSLQLPVEMKLLLSDCFISKRHCIEFWSNSSPIRT